MKRGWVVLLAGSAVVLCTAFGRLQAAGPKQGSGAGPDATSPERALVNKYCVTCHNQKAKTAGLTLDTLDLADPSAGAEVWEKVIRKVRGGLMPPVGMPRPEKAALTGLASYLETSIDRAAAARPNPGRTILHRLNRAEYGNAIRDLLALDLDVTSLLPPDDSAYGFDNIADVLGVSPALMEDASPRLPESSAASSERMSPNMLVVTITS